MVTFTGRGPPQSMCARMCTCFTGDTSNFPKCSSVGAWVYLQKGVHVLPNVCVFVIVSVCVVYVRVCMCVYVFVFVIVSL
jgi:hypothetical protein